VASPPALGGTDRQSQVPCTRRADWRLPLKLCGPSSNKNPSRRSEQITPPARGEASNTRASIPALFRAYAQTKPEMPAPMTIAGAEEVMPGNA